MYTIIWLLFTVIASAQQPLVKGKLTDDTGKAIKGALIVLSGNPEIKA